MPLAAVPQLGSPSGGVTVAHHRQRTPRLEPPPSHHAGADSWCGGGEGLIMVLEPRRVAARGAAHRMASLLGQPVGGEVGYYY